MVVQMKDHIAQITCKHICFAFVVLHGKVLLFYKQKKTNQPTNKKLELQLPTYTTDMAMPDLHLQPMPQLAVMSDP